MMCGARPAGGVGRPDGELPQVRLGAAQHLVRRRADAPVVLGARAGPGVRDWQILLATS
jgi:hypothetical protein